MVRAWYRADCGNDRGAMLLDPPEFINVQEMMRRTGIVCLQFNAESCNTDSEYATLKDSRSYTYEDTCEITREAIPDYDTVVKNFATEHVHPDEEVRFVIAGTGYFDIRDWDDRWIRLEASKGDLLILPAGIYHRFVLNEKGYMKVKRLFAGVPRWTAYFRPDGDDHPTRRHYLKHMAEVRQRSGEILTGNNVKAN